jgi:5-methyltetrahydropteroyltriglutamate--homocysteine methyltransferase
MRDLPLFPCTIVGSYPQPDWLIDRGKLSGRFPPRTRARELWRVAPEFLEEAQRDATRIAIQDQERAGLDIITDGEVCRESYSNHFATALDGLDLDNPGEALDRSGEPVFVPRIVGPIRRRHPVGIEDIQFLRANTDRGVKLTVPGPFTMAQQAQNDYYATDREAALDYAAAVNEEIRDLFAAGADVVQLDEPYMQARPQQAQEYGLEVLNRALDGVEGKTCVHICFGYAALIHERPEGYSYLPELSGACCDQISIETGQSNLDCSVLDHLQNKDILLGVLDLSTEEVETVELIKARVLRAVTHIDAERIILAPDCGMKYLSRDSAFGKLQAMVQAAKELREEFATQ